MKLATIPAPKPCACPAIGSRFNGPSIRKDADGTFEAVLPELTADEEQLQDALIAWSLPRAKFKRGLFSLEYEVSP